MQQHHSGLSLHDLAAFTGVSTQTIRNKLKKYGYLQAQYKVGNKIVLPLNVAQEFIAQCYPMLYNEFINLNKCFVSRNCEVSMFPIPTGKGRITTSKQRSGSIYYYVRDLPLYTDKDGQIFRYNSKGYPNKPDAEAHRKQIIADRDNGIYKLKYIEDLARGNTNDKTSKPLPKGAEQSYYEFCLNFFNSREYAEATLELYLHVIEKRIKPNFKDVQIKDLTRGMLQAFVDQYSTDIKNTFIVLRQTLKKLYSLDLIPTNYYDALIKPKSKGTLHPKNALSQDEVKLLLSHFKGHRLEHAMMLIFNTGLRIGELLALQWNEIEIIDDSQGLVHVNSSWGKTTYGMQRKAPKTKSSKRTIPFNNKALVTALKLAKKRSKSNWVVENERGSGPMDKHNFSKRYFTKVAQELKIEKHISSHSARHTYISHLVERGVPYTTIAKLAGHDTTEMIIKVYAHAVQDEAQEFLYVHNLYT